ncbi:hypothetical protein QQF64_022744 [Cirrhinus molitorella]|uniref:E3 ubiquitin-protein ligase ZNRF1 n=1 Tax=Cirrhinus molitorella TaxID=172907 RepID=A0ABR3L761_9TELE
MRKGCLFKTRPVGFMVGCEVPNRVSMTCRCFSVYEGHNSALWDSMCEWLSLSVFPYGPSVDVRGQGFKCPVCSKSVASNEMEVHFIMCLSKPRLSYNDDVLSRDAGECVICLEELQQGDTIARLPCLCIYHKSCIDSWFEINRSCPEHPSD